MKQAEFDKVFQEAIAQANNLLATKGVEYTGPQTQDRLANFKRGATLTGCTPLQVAFVYASKHYDAISTFVQNDAKGTQQVLSEPIEGRLHDLMNYCILMLAIVQEASVSQIPPSTGVGYFSTANLPTTEECKRV